ncbi:MAG TPA: hypothetical protein VIZ00_10610, partial [Streptosporangiaceae bacterium]
MDLLVQPKGTPPGAPTQVAPPSELIHPLSWWGAPGVSPVTISESPAVVVAVIWAALRPFTPSLTRAVFHTWLFQAASVGWAKSPSTTRLGPDSSSGGGVPAVRGAGWRAPSASGARTARPSASPGRCWPR